MSDASNGKLPVSFWIIGGVFLLWNFLGLMIYYDQVTMSPEVLANNFSPAQQAFLTNIPLWATSAHAIAVTAGVIASILLLVRKSLALPVYVVSLIGVVVQDLHAFVVAGGLAVWGTGSLVIPTIVAIVCVAEIWYSRSAKNKGWLS